MTIERAADAIIKSDWPGYREAFDPCDLQAIDEMFAEGAISREEWQFQRAKFFRRRSELITPSPSGAWETYAAQSARLARADRRHAVRIQWQIALAIGVNTAVAFGLGVWWGRS